jgi:hypothetical protein
VSSLRSKIVGTRLAQRVFHWDRNFLLRQVPAGGVAAEIGVWKGDFSKAILEIARPTKLHLIDPWKFEPSEEYAESLYGRNAVAGQAAMDATFEGVRRRFAREIAAGTVAVHRAASSDAAGEFADGSLDWVYIDGNHLYEHVKADLEAYCRKVRPGGYLAGDDYGVAGWWHDGVTRAVDEFATSGACRKVLVKSQQFLLQRPP